MARGFGRLAGHDQELTRRLVSPGANTRLVRGRDLDYQDAVTDWESIDWEALDRLRLGFLQGTAGEADYWRSESDVASYDRTYAQRIGWKWDHVLEELKRLGWTPPGVRIADWGCGSGIAHRALLLAFPSMVSHGVTLCDRSPTATRYASRRAVQRFPSLDVRIAESPEAGGLLLLSHVLTELDTDALEELLRMVSKAESVLWVEPGTYETSRRLIQVRERLRDQFRIVAPCVHSGTCGMLTEENHPHWCHHFAAPPPEVFTDAGWATFSRLTGIDLRSLPVSYLVLDRRPWNHPGAMDGRVRMIGTPRVYKAHIQILGCSATGVCDCRATKRETPEAFRLAKKGKLPSLQHWIQDGREIRSIQVDSPATPDPSPSPEDSSGEGG